MLPKVSDVIKRRQYRDCLRTFYLLTSIILYSCNSHIIHKQTRGVAILPPLALGSDIHWQHSHRDLTRPGGPVGVFSN